MESIEKILQDLHSSVSPIGLTYENDGNESVLTDRPEADPGEADPVVLGSILESIVLAQLEDGANSADVEYIFSLLFSIPRPYATSLIIKEADDEDVDIEGTIAVDTEKQNDTDSFPGLLHFLVSSIKNKDKEITKSKVQLLKFIALILKIVRNNPQFSFDSYRVGLFVVLYDIFRREDSGDIRTACLQPLKNIIRAIPLSFSAEAIRLDLLYDYLITEIKQTKYSSKTIKGETLKLLGLLVHAFPHHPNTLNAIESILSVCESVLQKNFGAVGSKGEPELGPIAGAFSCIDRCLFNFEEKFTNNENLWKNALQTIKATSNAEISRFAATSKALRLIKNHAALFQKVIGLNAKTTYDILFHCHTIAKESLKKHMDDSLYAVVTEIAHYVVINSPLIQPGAKDALEPSNTKKRKVNDSVPSALRGAVETVRQLFDSYLKLVQDESSGDILYAVRGITCLAPAALLCLGDSVSLLDILNTLINSADHYLASTDLSSMEDVEEVSITRLHSKKARNKILYLNAVTALIYSHSMTTHAKNQPLVFPEKLRVFLQEFSVDTVMGYSKVWPTTQAISCRTLCMLMHALCHLQSFHQQRSSNSASHVKDEFAMTNIFSDYLAVLMPALFLRTISRKLEGEELTSSMVSLSAITGEVDDRLFHVYINLWAELLEPADKQTKALLIVNYKPDYLLCVSKHLSEEFITYLIRTIKLLDISYTYNDTASTVLPNNIADQDILLNTVSFMEQFLQRIRSFDTLRWFPPLTALLIELSTLYPLVSAIYRFLTTILAVVEAGIERALHSKTPSDTASISITVAEIRTFLLGIQAKAASENFFRDELLDVALKLILTAPTTVLSFSDVAAAIQMSLQNGLQVSVCVEFITKHLLLNSEEVIAQVPSFVRLFDKYLLAFEEDKAQEKVKKTITKSAKVSTDAGVDSAVTTKALQISILSFLGRLGGHNQRLLAAPQDSVSSSLCWTVEDSLVIEYPVSLIGDDKNSAEELRLCFDKLLPRLTAICISSHAVDKQLVVAAGECLHSLIIFMIGRAAFTKTTTKSSKFAELYEKVFPVVIKLSASANFACQVVFETLLFQIVHWFAGQNQVHEEESAALIDAFIGCICSSSADNSEKNLCHRGLTELFVWTIKQSTKKGPEGYLRAVDSVLMKLLNLLARPTVEDWFAAATILNKIYKHLREEPALVNKYALRICFLLLQVQRHEEIQSMEEISQVLGKFEEIIVKSVLRNNANTLLLIVQEDRGFPYSLGELVTWLWSHCLLSEVTLLRRSCMRCFSSFCPLLSHTQGAAKNVSSRESVVAYINRFALSNGGEIGDDPIAIMQHINREKSSNSIQSLLSSTGKEEVQQQLQLESSWKTLVSILDSYTWLVKMGYITPLQLFQCVSTCHVESIVSLDIFVDATAAPTVIPEKSKKRKEPGASQSTTSQPKLAAPKQPFLCKAIFDIQRFFSHLKGVAIGDKDAIVVKQLEENVLEVAYRIILFINSVLLVLDDVDVLDYVIVKSLDSNSLHLLPFNAVQFSSIRNLRVHGTARSIVAQYLQVSGLFCNDFHELVLDILLPHIEGSQLRRSVVVGGIATSSRFNFSFALKHFFKFLQILEPSDSSDNPFRTILHVRAASLLRAMQTLDLPESSFSLAVEFFRVMKDSNLESSAFGMSYSAVLRKLAGSMVNAVLLRLRAPDGSVSNSQLSPAQQIMCSEAVALSLSIGLPMDVDSEEEEGAMIICGGKVEPSALKSENANTSLLLLLSVSEGKIISEIFHSSFVEALLDHNSNCSLWDWKNIQPFMLSCATNVPTHALRKEILLKLLSDVLLSIIAAQQTRSGRYTKQAISDIVIGYSVPYISELPSNIVSLLLELDSYMEKENRNKSLYAFALNKFLATAIDARAPCDVIVEQLGILPFIICGTTVKSRRPLAIFGEEYASEDKIVNALEELIVNRFPLKSSLLSSGTIQGKEYLRVLKAYCSAVTKCGSVNLLRPLIPTLREGSAHRYYKLLQYSLRLMVHRVRKSSDPLETDSLHASSSSDSACCEVKTICSFCIEQMMDLYQDLDVKKTLFNELCIPVLQRCDSKDLVSIFCSSFNSFRFVEGSIKCVIIQLYEVIQKEPTFSLSDEEKRCLFVTQASAYRIIETLFERCSLSEIKQDITTAFVGAKSTGKEFTQSICKAAYKVLKTTFLCSNQESIQLLYSSAYRCLALTVAKTQTEEQFFETFLFKEKAGEAIWSKFIDCSVTYKFDSKSGPFKTIVISGETFLSETEGNKGSAVSASRGGLTYLSQYFSGTLVEGSNAMSQPIVSRPTDNAVNKKIEYKNGSEFEPSQYEVIATQDLPMDVDARKDFVDSDYSINNRYTATVEGLDDQVIYLEMNDVNMQPVMPILVRVIQRMSILLEDKWRDTLPADVMPGWLNLLREKLDDPYVNSHVQIFIVRLFLNQPVSSIVKPWVKTLLPSMLNFLVKHLCGGSPTDTESENKIFAHGYSYFLKDFFFVACECWQCELPHSSLGNAALLLSYVLKHIYTDDSSMLKEHIMSVSRIFKLWVGLAEDNQRDNVFTMFQLDLQPLLEYLSSASAPTGGAHAKVSSRGTEMVKKRLLGLDLLKILLEVRYPLFNRPTYGATFTAQSLLAAVVDCMKYPRKEVMEYSSLLAGCMLKRIQESNRMQLDNECSRFEEMVATVVDSLYRQKDGIEIVTFSLRAISLNYPSFLSREMLFKSLLSFSRLKSRGKYLYLDLLLQTTTVFEDVSIPNQFKAQMPTLLGDITHFAFGRSTRMVRLPMVQITVVMLLMKYVENLSEDFIQQLLGIGQGDGLGTLLNEQCSRYLREVTYQLLINLLMRNEVLKLHLPSADKTDLLMMFSSVEKVKRLQMYVIILLLRGLKDPDDGGMDSDEGTENAAKFSFLTSREEGFQLHDRIPKFVNDENPHRIGIRKQIFQYFNGCFGLSSAIYSRLLRLMVEMFEPSESGQWLHYTSYLLLSLCKDGQQYEKKVFTDNLADTTSYSDMDVRGSMSSSASQAFGSGLTAKAPLFSLERIQHTLSQVDANMAGKLEDSTGEYQTYLSQLGSQSTSNSYIANRVRGNFGSQQNNDSISGSRLGRLRGTQQFSWTQTQEPGTVDVKQTHLVPSSASVKKPLIDRASTQYIPGATQATSSASAYSQSQSSKQLSISSGSQVAGSGNASIMGPPIGVPLYVTTQKVPLRKAKEDSQSQTEHGYKVKRVFSGLSTVLSAKKIAEQRLKMEQKVVIYRKYKSGELPDVGIKYSDILRPLQALCLLDTSIAAITFGMLYDQLVAKLLIHSSSQITSSTKLPMYRSLCAALSNMLEKQRHTQANSLLTATLLQRCIQHIRVEKKCTDALEVFPVPDQLISELSIQTLNYHTGIQLLEECLLARGKPVSQKRSKKAEKASSAVEPSLDNQMWRQLSRLYDDIGENVILIGLSSRISGSHVQETKSALDAEISGEYLEAIRIYSDLNAQSAVADADEREMWEDRLLNSCRELCDWEKLYEKVESVTRNSLQSIDSTFYAQEQEGDSLLTLLSSLSVESPAENRLKERVFPHYISSLFHLGAEKESEFCSFIDRMMSYKRVSQHSSERTDLYRLRMWTEGNFSIEIAASFAMRKQWAKVLVYTQKCYDIFLSNWAAIHPCAYQARKRLLQSLQRIVELQDSASAFLHRTNGIKGLSEKEMLLSRWSACEPSISDPLHHLASVCQVRENILLQPISSKPTELEKKSYIQMANFHVLIAIAAVNHGILNAVKPQLTMNDALRKKVLLKNESSLITMREVEVVFFYNKKSIAREKDGDNGDVADKYAKTMRLLERKAGLQARERVRDIRETIQIQFMRADWTAAWGRFERFSGPGPTRMLSYKTKTFDALKVYHDSLAELDTQASSAIPSMKSAIFGRLALQYDQLLEDLEGEDREVFSDVEDDLTSRGIDVESICNNSRILSRPDEIAASLLVDTYMKGLVYGNTFCRERLVRLLKIVGRFLHTSEIVKQRISEVPTWVFIQHAAQFIGSLDQPEGPVVADILLRVTTDYPNAIYYPFKITTEFLGSKGKELSKPLENILGRNKALDCFVEALGGLTHPELRFKDGMKALQERFVQCKDSKNCGQAMLPHYLAFRQSVAHTSWPSVGDKIGLYNKKRAEEIKIIIDAVAGAGGEKMRTSPVATLQGLVGAVGKIMNQMKFPVGSVNLTEFSTWLDDFVPAEHRIEIPGQYLAYTDRPPPVERHELLATIDKSLRVIASIRKPKRIGLLGSGGGHHLFLVKGGEDLRNDERIELIFALMNSIVEKKMASDQTTIVKNESSHTSNTNLGHGLRARTYAVIPMSSKVGILQWVSNTVPLQSIIAEEIAKDVDFCKKNPSLQGNRSQSADLTKLEAFKSRANWVGVANEVEDYHKMIKNASKEDAEAKFKAISDSIPTDFLRRRLISMSSNPETFLTLRTEFAKTLAISSLFGYILGLGDRHLDNLMMDTKTGGILQIDFGICFGMGSSVLPVPEFIPFRLTAQLRGILQPLDGTGLLRHYMVMTMQCLRDEEFAEGIQRNRNSSGRRTSNGILTNALEVYVNDPVVDWLKAPLAKEDLMQLSDNVSWEPRRRVNIAISKLMGLDPAQLLVEDLSMNLYVKPTKFNSLASLTQIIQAAYQDAGIPVGAVGDEALLDVGQQMDR